MSVRPLEGRGVVGYHVLSAILGADRELVVGNAVLGQHLANTVLRAVRIRKIILKWRADQVFGRAARDRAHLTVNVGDDPERIGSHQRVDVRLDQASRVGLLLPHRLFDLFLLRDVASGGENTDHGSARIPKDGSVDHTTSDAPSIWQPPTRRY